MSGMGRKKTFAVTLYSRFWPLADGLVLRREMVKVDAAFA